MYMWDVLQFTFLIHSYPSINTPSNTSADDIVTHKVPHDIYTRTDIPENFARYLFVSTRLPS